ncbi:hypothetical protein JHK84_050990 [Glycine max]|nr:hypothetical protein JHK84_050990 [Glycine max]
MEFWRPETTIKGSAEERMTGWRMIMMCCLCAKLGLLIQKRKCMYTLENVDPMGGPVSEIGPVIKVHAMPINCSAENVVETVTEECTQNGIEDMDDDGAKGGSDDENEVVGLGVQDVETEVVETTVETEPEVVGVETEVNSDADDDEVKERDGDGLLPTMQEVMPCVKHRYCVMHFMEEFLKAVERQRVKRCSLEVCTIYY